MATKPCATPDDVARRAAAHRSLMARLRSPERPVAATLVDVRGSRPLQSGATIPVDGAGNVDGSVSGACADGAVLAYARQVFAGGLPRIVSHGITDG